MKVIIIGAGWAGCQMTAVLKNKYGCEVLTLEKGSSIGGTWAKGTAYSTLGTHAAASTLEFMDFPYPKDILENRCERVPAEKVRAYMERYLDAADIRENIKINSNVTLINHKTDKTVQVTVEDTQSGEVRTESGDFLFMTGFGYRARDLPDYEGKENFQRPIYTSHDVQEKQLEEFKQSGKPVVVVGGSKAAYDMIYQLSLRNIPVHWVARQTYYMTNFEKVVPTDVEGKQKKFSRTLSTIGHGLYSYSPTLSVKFLKASGIIHNPHPKTTKNAYHLGVVDKDMFKAAENAPFTHGNVIGYKEGKVCVKIAKGDTTTEIDTCAVVAALGTDTFAAYPEIQCQGETLDLSKSKHIFQFAIHHKLPRIYFCGPSLLKGFGMLNGYHSVQHAIIYLSKQLSSEEIEKRAISELKQVKKHFKGKPVPPHFTRSITDHGNFFKFLQMVDSIEHRIGYSKLLNLSLVTFIYNTYYTYKSLPAYNDPSLKQVKKAFGPNSKIVKGRGLIQRK